MSSQPALFQERDDLLFLIGTTLPASSILPDAIILIPYRHFINDLDAMVRADEDYEMGSLPLINPATLPAEDELRLRTAHVLDRERRLLAFTIARSCYEFLWLNRHFPGSRHAGLMSAQISALGALHMLAAKILPELRLKDLAAKHQIELPAPLMIRIQDMEAA